MKKLLIITMLLGVQIGYSQPCSLGDMTGDGSWNVLDIVILANCVLADNCQEYAGSCSWWCDTADMNGDLNYNILDIVILSACVLADDCYPY